MNYRIKKLVVVIILFAILVSCSSQTKIENKNENINVTTESYDANKSESKSAESSSLQNDISNDSETIDVKFKLGKYKDYDNIVVEDVDKLKNEGREHSVKYHAYIPLVKKDGQDFKYYDVVGNERFMKVNENIVKNNYKWEDAEGVLSKKSPIGYKMIYGIDISKHNGNIDFDKVKKAGFEFVFIRIAYRTYGQSGTLKVDEMQDVNLKKAKEAGLKVGAYVFSQSLNVDEAKEEAKLAIDLLKGYDLDLSLVYDPETIKGDIARSDDVTGTVWTECAIAFCDEVKKAGFKPAIYSNMVWEDYYFDMEKLKDYGIWYADYSNIPQTPYDFKYWQFSEVGIVDGVDGIVDLDVMIE